MEDKKGLSECSAVPAEEGPELILPDNMYFYIRDKILKEKAQELQKKLNTAIDNALDYYNEGIKEGNTISKNDMILLLE